MLPLPVMSLEDVCLLYITGIPEPSDWQHRSWEQCVNGVPAFSLSTPGPFAARDKMTALKVSAQQSRKEPHPAPSEPSPRALTFVACYPLTSLGLVALGL